MTFDPYADIIDLRDAIQAIGDDEPEGIIAGEFMPANVE